MSIDYRPQQSFQHTLKEIAVNRQDPCELVRELISNAYDAKATEIMVVPYLQKKGLIFFDNGVGLSESEADKKNGIVPDRILFHRQNHQDQRKRNRLQMPRVETVLRFFTCNRDYPLLLAKTSGA